jgi:hypothetical protein
MEDDYVTKDEAAATELRLVERIDSTELRLLERIEKVETTLLKEFRKWAISFESKFRANESLVAGFSERLTSLEERVSDLENPSTNH